MTRDEAIKILSRIWGGDPQHTLANSYADAFVALGMLKLDEPKGAEEQYFEAILSHGFYKSVAEQTLAIMAASGLKVVKR